MAIPTTRSSRREGSTCSCYGAETVPATTSRTSCCSTSTSSPASSDYVELGLWRGQPGRAGCWPSRSTSTATRSTSCASATWPPGEDLADVVPAQLLRRRVERGLGVLLLHGARRDLPAAPGLAAPARDAGPPRTSWCWRSRTSGSSSSVRASPQRRAGGDLVGEPRHQRGLGRRRRATRPRAARSVGGRRARRRVPRRARAARRRLRRAAGGHQRRGDRVPAGPLPGAARGRPGPTAWAAVRPEDPAERLERVDAFAGARGADLARRRAQPAARPAARRPRRRRARRPAGLRHRVARRRRSSRNVEHDVDRGHRRATSPT